MKEQKLYCIWLFQTLLVSKFTFGGFERTNSKHRGKEREGKRFCFERYCTNEHFNSNTKEQFLFRNLFKIETFTRTKFPNGTCRFFTIAQSLVLMCTYWILVSSRTNNIKNEYQSTVFPRTTAELNSKSIPSKQYTTHRNNYLTI